MKKVLFTNDELIGMKFGLLTIQEIDDFAAGHHMAHCNCDCGAYTVARKSDVIRRHTTSCGCLAKARRRKQNAESYVKWNPRRRKFGAYLEGNLIGYFYEEALAKIALGN